AVTWSTEQCRLFGIPVGSPASYEGFVTRVHPEDRERVQGIIAEGLAERRTKEYEWRLVRSDNAIRHMHTVSIVVTDEAGKPVRMAGTSVGITDRKLAEEKQQTRLHGLQAALPPVESHASTPGRIATGRSDTETRKRVAALGVGPVLIKPVDTDVLLTAIRAALETDTKPE